MSQIQSLSFMQSQTETKLSSTPGPPESSNYIDVHLGYSEHRLKVV